jgi:hypothetical protein
MKARGRTFDVDHWNTAFTLPGPTIIRKLAVRPLGNNHIESFRDATVRAIPRWRNRLVEVGKQNVALFDTIAALRNARVFVDASKDPTRVRFLRGYSKIEPYVIHLVRDPVGFVNSYRKHVKSPRAFAVAIRWWNWTAGRMERLRKITDSTRWLRVRYESLCEDTPRELQRILRFLRIESGEPVLDFRTLPHHIIGNRMRLSNISEIRLDCSWESELSDVQVEHVMRSTRRFREILGYSVTPSRCARGLSTVAKGKSSMPFGGFEGSSRRGHL